MTIDAKRALPPCCNGCGAQLLLLHLLCDDGCQCNTRRGVNLAPQPCALCGTDDCVKPVHRAVAASVIALTAERDRLRAELADARISRDRFEEELLDERHHHTAAKQMRDEYHAERDAAIAERDAAHNTIAQAWSSLTGWDAVRIKNGSHVASRDPSEALLSACTQTDRYLKAAWDRIAELEAERAKRHVEHCCHTGTLIDNRDDAVAERDKAEAALATARERIGVLEEALRPFAAIADEIRPTFPDDGSSTGPIRIGDFRRARAALADESEGT